MHCFLSWLIWHDNCSLSLQLFTFASCGIAFVYSLFCYCYQRSVLSLLLLLLCIDRWSSCSLFCFVSIYWFHQFLFASLEILQLFSVCHPKEIVKNQLPDLFLKTFSEYWMSHFTVIEVNLQSLNKDIKKVKSFWNNFFTMLK